MDPERSLKSPVGFLLHPSSPLHDTGWGHPEHQGRLRALASTVGKDLLTLHGHVLQEEPGPATVEDLLRVHTADHVGRVRAACQRAVDEGRVVPVDTDTKASPATWDAVLGSSGAAIQACRQVVEGTMSRAFVATRPPGHHATPDRAMGFCLANHVAVAARWLQAKGHAERVLIVDWDVHHGNGTQDIFYDDPSVFFLSLHQSPHYPGTGAADETGLGAGEGTTLNVPLPAGVSREEYRTRFTDALGEAFEAADPDFVLVSCGFDCMAGDPLGDFPLEPTDLHAMTRELVDQARDACQGRVVVLLEGGYEPPRVGAGAVAVIRALAGLDAPD